DVDSNGVSTPHAVIFSSGTVLDLDSGNTYSPYGSQGFGINEAGQVVGAKDRTAFFYSGGSFHNLGPLPGDTDSSAYGVNDATANHSVQVVGNSAQLVGVSPSNIYRAFVWDSTHGMQSLDGLSPTGYSVAKDINASGQIVGYSKGNVAGLFTAV